MAHELSSINKPYIPLYPVWVHPDS